MLQLIGQLLYLRMLTQGASEPSNERELEGRLDNQGKVSLSTPHHIEADEWYGV